MPNSNAAIQQGSATDEVVGAETAVVTGFNNLNAAASQEDKDAADQEISSALRTLDRLVHTDKRSGSIDDLIAQLMSDE